MVNKEIGNNCSDLHSASQNSGLQEVHILPLHWSKHLGGSRTVQFSSLDVIIWKKKQMSPSLKEM